MRGREYELVVGNEMVCGAEICCETRGVELRYGMCGMRKERIGCG